jgi:hypothetical protein
MTVARKTQKTHLSRFAVAQKVAQPIPAHDAPVRELFACPRSRAPLRRRRAAAPMSPLTILRREPEPQEPLTSRAWCVARAREYGRGEHQLNCRQVLQPQVNFSPAIGRASRSSCIAQRAARRGYLLVSAGRVE